MCIALWIFGKAIFLLLESCNKGLDISDEGFALLSIRAAALGHSYGSPFALYTKMLYQVTGNHVVVFRRVSITIAPISAFVLGCHIPSRSPHFH